MACACVRERPGTHLNQTEGNVDKDELKGKAKDVTGRAKEGLGEATGNERMENEGRADQAEGNIQEAYGKGKRKLDEAADKLTD
jgi:uncharacterized protein YjbJ (UPF0337 family)